MIIKEVKKEIVWEIRHQVMWSEKPFDFIKLPRDDFGIHFALYKDEQIISVISLFIEKNQGQFRKFATITSMQQKGYGRMLLTYLINYAQSINLTSIWCNAREEKSSFYEKFGLRNADKSFIKENKKYLIMTKNL